MCTSYFLKNAKLQEAEIVSMDDKSSGKKKPEQLKIIPRNTGFKNKVAGG